MNYILVTDVGSTTTKARLFKRMEKGEWRYVVSGEAPTTVEDPYEDVTLGVRNAVREIEELTGHSILSEDDSGITVPHSGDMGVDLYCTTSSAGGGLQMMVTGVIKKMTAESANRAALGAGAIVMEVLATNDYRPPYKKIQLIRSLRPDMILMAGGTNDGTISHVVKMAELITSADPKPRFGISYRLPIIYAGNETARPYIEKLMEGPFALNCVDNVRPVLEVENTEPARREVHELFMEHVMSHAPGYTKLMKWTDVDIMPTPAGEGRAMQLLASTYDMNLLGVGLGGATTNIYSIFNGKFVRSVSANLGMSYSICNVMREAGIGNIMRWLPFDVEESDVKNRLRNKMIRPTTIPETLRELIIEHAVAREALRLGLKQHKTIATILKGGRGEVAFLRGMTAPAVAETYIDLMNFGIIAGTGGLLSHAPRRVQSMMVLIDAFQPEGVTRMFQDSIFMMPHLGVLSTVYKEAAWQVFDKDCLVRLGTVIAPKDIAKRTDEVVMDLEIESDEGLIKDQVRCGEVKRLDLAEGKKAVATIYPNKGLDVGMGPGKEFKTEIDGGVVGVVLDGRARPLRLLDDDEERRRKLLEWWRALKMYSEEHLKREI